MYTRAFIFILLSLLSIAGSTQTHAENSVSGKYLYNQYCSDCHAMSLRGSAHGSELVGSAFIKKWSTLGFDELDTAIRSSMPPGKAGQLKSQTYRSIHRHILSVSGVSIAAGVGESAAAEDQNALASNIPVTPILEGFVSFSEQETVNALGQSGSRFNNQVLTDFKLVDEAAIEKPAASDWLSWRRTQDGQGYSPLRKIHRGNVNKLTLAWSMTMEEGSNQGTPLVSQGIMFLTHPGNVVQALDASNGDLIWTFEYDYPEESRTLGGPTRNIALYQDKIFMATYDAAIIAIDAKTGKLLWRTVKADYRDGFTHTSGPTLANGVIVSGINGCERFVKDGCFITGHDPDSGKELWRTSTIALPGDPNDATLSTCR